MLRDTRTAFSLPFAHARHGSIARRRARTCWFVTGQWLHVEPTCVAWFLNCGLHCCFRKLFATYTLHCQTWPSICFVLTFGEHVHRNMKQKCSMRRLTITGGSEKDVRVSRRMDCRFGVIKSHVSDNSKNSYVSWLMCHVYKFMCYSFVELKLKINTRSLFNRTLNRAHPPLLCCALLALKSIQLMTGEPRPRYNALQLLGVSGACGLAHCSMGTTITSASWDAYDVMWSHLHTAHSMET